MSTYEATVALLQGLSEEELTAIQAVARAFRAKAEEGSISGGNNEDTFYKPMTEEQLLDRIDLAIEHSKQGLGEDAHAVASQLRSEFAR